MYVQWRVAPECPPDSEDGRIRYSRLRVGTFYPDPAARTRMKRAWVRSEYAGELAVLLTWVSALLPWSVSLARISADITFAVVRFPFFLFQFVYGVQLTGAERPFLTVVDAPAFPGESGVVLAYQVWLVGAFAFALAFLYSVAYYLDEERIESGPVDPVRVLGAALVLSAVVLSASTWLLWQHFTGLSVPVGVLFLSLFGAVLLTVERT